MHTKLHAIMTVTLMFCLSLGAQGQSPTPKGDAAKAEELLSLAREALGGASKLKAVHSLSAAGSFRRQLGDHEMNGELEVELMLPDKYKRTETLSGMGGTEVTRVEAVSGEKAWTDMQSGGGGGGMVLIRRPGGDGPQAQIALANAARADFARAALGWLLMPLASFPLEFAYAGQAEASDGRADVLDVKGPNNFAARLYLDQTTHRPLMLSYMGRAPRVVMRTLSGPPPSREEMEKRAREMPEAAPAEPEVEMQVRFADYRAVDGVFLPHHISRATNGETSEEWEVKRFRVNPALKPASFEKK